MTLTADRAPTCWRSSTAAASTSAPTPAAPPRPARSGPATLNTTTISGLLTPGSTFDGIVRHDQPGRLGLRPRRLDLPRLDRQPGVRRRRRSDGTSVVTYGATPDEKYGYEANAAGLDRPPGRRRQAVRLRPRGPARVQPVLPLLEGAGRAARAQRGAVPERRRDRRAAPRRRSPPSPRPSVGRDRPGGGAGRRRRSCPRSAQARRSRPARRPTAMSASRSSAPTAPSSRRP